MNAERRTIIKQRAWCYVEGLDNLPQSSVLHIGWHIVTGANKKKPRSVCTTVDGVGSESSRTVSAD